MFAAIRDVSFSPLALPCCQEIDEPGDLLVYRDFFLRKSDKHRSARFIWQERLFEARRYCSQQAYSFGRRNCDELCRTLAEGGVASTHRGHARAGVDV